MPTRSEEQAIISYADTTLGCIFFNIPGQSEEAAYNLAVASAKHRKDSSEARTQYIHHLIHFLHTQHRSLFLHEWYHILQAIVYTGLYLRCVREIWLLMSLMTTLRQNHEPEIPIRWWLPQEWHDTLIGPTLLYKADIDRTGNVRDGWGDPEDRRANDLCENDLLEEDAQIFQHKVELGAYGTGESYELWLRERRRYTMAFKFLARLLGRENAYIALPPLVRAAFHTTRPVPTFVGLTALTIRCDRDLPTSEGPKGYEEFLYMVLGQNKPTGRTPNPERPSLEDDDVVLTMSARNELIEHSTRHPLQPLARDIFIERQLGQVVYEWMLHPYRALRDGGTVAPEPLLDCLPPLTVIRLLDTHISLRDAVFIVAERFNEKPLPFAPQITYNQYLGEMVNRRYAIFSLFAGMYDNYPHNCHHISCPYFSTNLCRRWMVIPERHEECDFPTMFEIATHHHLDDGVLKPREPQKGKSERSRHGRTQD